MNAQINQTPENEEMPKADHSRFDAIFGKFFADDDTYIYQPTAEEIAAEAEAETAKQTEIIAILSKPEADRTNADYYRLVELKAARLHGDVADPETNPYFEILVSIPTPDYAEIAEALEIVAATRPSVGTSEEMALDDYLSMVWEGSEDKQEVKRAKELHAKGKEYYAQGYRLHSHNREVVAHASAPAKALYSYRKDSGYLATNQTSRLMWLTKE